MLPKLIRRFNTITAKIAARVSIHAEKMILKFTRRGKRSGTAKPTLKENKVGGISLLMLRLLYS